jgi:hypothetical protein
MLSQCYLVLSHCCLTNLVVFSTLFIVPHVTLFFNVFSMLLGVVPLLFNNFGCLFNIAWCPPCDFDVSWHAHHHRKNNVILRYVGAWYVIGSGGNSPSYVQYGAPIRDMSGSSYTSGIHIFQIPSPIRAFQRSLSTNQPLIIFKAIDLTKVGSSSTQDVDMNLIKIWKSEATLDMKKEGQNHYGKFHQEMKDAMTIGHQPFIWIWQMHKVSSRSWSEFGQEPWKKTHINTLTS